MNSYSIWILEYAYVPNYPESGIIYGAHNQGTRKLPYCYALIKGNDHVAMVDVGYNHRDYGEVLANRFGVENWHSPKHVLAKCGVAPEDVDSIFVTHTHFDHFGNSDAFPNATFYIQEREISKWIWAMSLPKRMQWLMSGTDPADVLRSVQLGQEGRLVTVDGDMPNVLPGIDLCAAFDTHTYGSMYVAIQTEQPQQASHNWIIAGDLIYVYENIEGTADAVGLDNVYVPVGLATGSQTNLILKTEEMMKKVGYEKRRIIPVHEERLRDEFASLIGDDGLRLTEVCVGTDEVSRIPDH